MRYIFYVGARRAVPFKWGARQGAPLLLILVITAVSASAPLQAFELKDPVLKDKKTGIEYMLTGFDKPSRERAQGLDFPCVFEFAKGYALYSDVKVLIKDQTDKKVFAVQANAPWLLVRLKHGTYHVEATDRHGVRRSVTAACPASGQQKYTLRW